MKWFPSYLFAILMGIFLLVYLWYSFIAFINRHKAPDEKTPIRAQKCSNCKWTEHIDYCDVDLPPWVALYLGEKNFPTLEQLEEENIGKYYVLWEPREQ